MTPIVLTSSSETTVLSVSIGTYQSSYGGGSVVERNQMRWYNPALGVFEWREVPKSDEEALSLFEGFPDAEAYLLIYWRWRELGASIMAALIRVGEAAKEENERI